MHGHFDANERGVPGFFLRNLDQPFRTAVRGAVKKRYEQDGHHRNGA